MNVDLSLLDLNNLEEELDFDYSVGEVYVDSMETFQRELLDPFLADDRMIFYRGERINQLNRPLLPTMFRNKNELIRKMDPDSFTVEMDSDYLIRYYQSFGGYYELFNSVFGEAGSYRLYDLCAFSQHYLNNSPLIDFTKSLFVALSFGLKEKTEFEDDAVLYTVEVNHKDNYTQDKVVAECWLHDYQVSVYDFDLAPDTPEIQKLKSTVKRTSPNAKLIDIATNDLMRFQQGVFLLLSDFNLVNHAYLTKNVRQSVKIRKFLIAKEICPQLVTMVAEEAPWYKFSNLLEISKGIASAMDHDKTSL